MPAQLTLEDWFERDQGDPETAGIWRRWCLVEMRREGVSGQECRRWGRAQGLGDEEIAVLLWPVGSAAVKPREKDPIAALRLVGDGGPPPMVPALRLLDLEEELGAGS